MTHCYLGIFILRSYFFGEKVSNRNSKRKIELADQEVRKRLRRISRNNSALVVIAFLHLLEQQISFLDSESCLENISRRGENLHKLDSICLIFCLFIPLNMEPMIKIPLQPSLQTQKNQLTPIYLEHVPLMSSSQ